MENKEYHQIKPAEKHFGITLIIYFFDDLPNYRRAQTCILGGVYYTFRPYLKKCLGMFNKLLYINN